jgi:hypothetical protein
VNVRARPARAIFLIGNVALALAVSVCLLAAFGAGLAGAPALGRRLVPGHAAQVPATVTPGHHARTPAATDSFDGRPEARR